jgi:hypothetical protein
MLRNDARHGLECSHVSGTASPHASRFGRCIHSDKDNVRLPNTLCDLGRKEQVGLPRLNDGRTPLVRLTLAPAFRRRCFFRPRVT